MAKGAWLAVVVGLVCVGCLGTEPPAEPEDISQRPSFEDEVAGPSGDDERLPQARGAERRGCIPVTCTDLAATCGSASDGCGGVLQCGSCGTGFECGLSEPYTCAPAESPRLCQPESCGVECGPRSDGCSGVIDCGPCT